MDAAVNVITRQMLRTFTGVAIDGQSLPTVFVASDEVAAEMVKRWNAFATFHRITTGEAQ